MTKNISEKLSKNKSPDIQFINGNWYNRNGRYPNKPITENYANRLLKNIEKYGKNVTTKEARGHGKLKEKKESYEKIKGKEKKSVKKGIYDLTKINLKNVPKKKLKSRNIVTRFRAGFKVHKYDDKRYESITHAKRVEGYRSLKSFIDAINDDMIFDKDISEGGFRYVIYDSETKEVLTDIQYGEQF